MGGKALLIGVRRFADRAGAESESPLTLGNRAPLGFVDDVQTRVRKALDRLGFHVDVKLDPDRNQMGESVQDALDDDSGNLVLHVVSHGEVGADDTRLDVVPACGRTGMGTNVAEWVSSGQLRDQPVLLLLDLCRSGRIARLPWLLQRTGQTTTTWVIAAAGPDEDAFDGRFSWAVADVLDRLAIDGLGADPSLRYVPLELVSRRIAKRVAAQNGLPQRVYATPVDPAQPAVELRFFLNPRYEPDHVVSKVLDPSLREYLDYAYFMERAGTHFTGRHRELRLLSLWLDGAASDRSIVITGSPGAGKSALLGVLVCAAHPTLAKEVPAVRVRLDTRSRPSLNPNLATVHARGRDTLQFVHSIADQLNLTAPQPDGFADNIGDWLDEIDNALWQLDCIPAAMRQSLSPGWNAATLVEAIAGLSEPPTIVLDALDEALDPIAVVNELLLPLLHAHRPTGERACRLLVATRPDAKFARLIAQTDVLDLDGVEADELGADLESHLMNRLADAPGYRPRSARLVRERLARVVAGRLASASRNWGAFLLAEVFLRYLEAVPVPADTERAFQLGLSMPTRLPEVFELHLGALGPDRTLRWALAAIAFGKGDGMPAELIATLVGVDVTDILVQGGPYLRTSADSDGTTLYRLFHHSLGEYLRSQHDTTRLYERIVAGVHSWRTAPPYLLRHAIEHAADANRVDDLLVDPGFLLMADPDAVVRCLGKARSPAAREAAVVYRTSAKRHRKATPDERREILAIDARRVGSHALVRTFAGTGLLTRWATGALVNPALRDDLPGYILPVSSVDCLRIGDEIIAVTWGSRTVRLWNLRHGRARQPARITLDHRYNAVAAFVADGRPVVAALDVESGIQIFDLITGEPGGRTQAPSGLSYHAVTAGTVDGHAVVVAGGFEGTVDVWPVSSFDEMGAESHKIGFHNETVRYANSFTADGATVVVTGDESGQINVRALSGRPIDATLAGHDGEVRGVSGVLHGADLYVVSTGEDGTVRMWNLKSDSPRSKMLTSGDVLAGPVACAIVDDRPIALVGRADDIELWDLRTRRRVGAPLNHTDSVRAIQCVDLDGAPVAVSTATSGTVRVWNLDVAVTDGSAVLPGHTEPFYAAACAVVDDRIVIVAGGGEVDSRQDGVAVWELANGTMIGEPFGRKVGWVAALATVRTGDTTVAVLAGGETSSLELWDLATAQTCGNLLEGHEGSVHDVAAANVGGRPLVISGGSDGVPRVWDLADGSCVTLPTTEADVAIDKVAIGDDGGAPYVVTWSERDSRLVVWDVLARVMRCRVEPGFTTGLVACATVTGRPVVVAAGEGVGVFDARTGACLRVMASPPGLYVRALSCGVRGGRAVAVTGCFDEVVRVWDLLTGECLDTHAVPDRADAVLLAPDGAIVVCYEREIVVLDRGE
ncbi:caspase family protein [Micromonospora peucetia]|uniref:caspase family protein n=1 Tax=Micromonospora peucetia TaxID=47871 RepID=UPI00224CC670|nr:caspase family protein [Micromonospora peucetia]MCX4388107.1 caspase family protein [Micromonospora peucetia]